MTTSAYTVYLLECNDGTLYAGITTDMERRLKEHNEGKNGAKYTKARRPVSLVYRELCSSRSEAQKREYQIRIMSRGDKVELIARS